MRRALAAVLVVAVLAFPVVFARPFPRHVMIMIFLYGALATAWNVLAGYCGQISLGHAVYFGIGAYTSTLLVREAALTPWLGMVAGAVLAVLVSQLIGYPVFRLRGHYFAIATIAVGEIAQTLVANWDWAGGARGLFVPIQRPDSLVRFQFHDSRAVYYYIALGLLLLALGVTYRLERSRRGRGRPLPEIPTPTWALASPSVARVGLGRQRHLVARRGDSLRTPDGLEMIDLRFGPSGARSSIWRD